MSFAAPVCVCVCAVSAYLVPCVRVRRYASVDVSRVASHFSLSKSWIRTVDALLPHGVLNSGGRYTLVQPCRVSVRVCRGDVNTSLLRARLCILRLSRSVRFIHFRLLTPSSPPSLIRPSASFVILSTCRPPSSMFLVSSTRVRTCAPIHPTAFLSHTPPPPLSRSLSLLCVTFPSLLFLSVFFFVLLDACVCVCVCALSVCCRAHMYHLVSLRTPPSSLCTNTTTSIVS